MSEKFEIVLQADGLFLTVFPDCNASLSDVSAQLRERGLLEYNGDLITQALTESLGVPVRIGEPQQEITREAEFRVRIADDALSCELWVVPPIGVPWPGPEKLRGALQEKGVIFGIDDTILQRICTEMISKQWVVVAKGIPPVNGKDAQIQYKVNVDVLRPKDRGHDNVDMKELGTVINVLKGQEIAEKIPIQAGTDGTSLMAKKLSAYIGKDKNLPGGKGTVVSEDGLRLLADMDGHLLIKKGKLNVEPHFEVKGDVDYGVGNIDFVGPVTVKGSVREGFEVVSGGILSIEGVVEGAILKSSSDISIRIGVRGTNKARIEAKGDVLCGYIDQAYVRSGGSIHVTGGILHSDVGAREEIILLGNKKGQIVGGKIQATVGVACEILGGEMGTKTEVIVGMMPEILEERTRLVENIKEIKERLTTAETNLGYLKVLETRGSLDNEKRGLLARLTKSKFQLISQLDTSTKRLAELEAQMERVKVEGRVRVRNICHPGVSITIRGITYLVREPLRFTSFVNESGEIRLKSFE